MTTLEEQEMKKEPDLAVKLQVEQLQRHLDQANNSLKEFTKLAQGSNELKEWAVNEITRYALSIRASKLDKDELGNFFKYPYVIMQGKREGQAYLAIPKFIDAQFGWLHKITPSYNIFLVNRYVDWLGELPKALKDELKFPDPLDIKLEGDYLVGPDIAKAKEKFKDFIKKAEKDRLLIDKSNYFEMLAALIREGILPFERRPVAQQDLTERMCNFELRDYQQEAWKEFLRYSAIGAFFPPSTGKTYLSIWAMTHIVPPHIVAVPTRLLVEQWKERIELYTDLKPEEYDVLTYQAAMKSTRHYKLKIIDEVHHLPANEFSKLAKIKSDYILGLSATPQREDEREDYIFALTGRPVGLAWETFKQLGIIQNPTLHVWIVKSESERLKELSNLLASKNHKTIIFCDSIAMGESIANKFDLPHVHGASKERLSAIKDANCSVVSRVGDEGISLPDITRVIEVSWLHGSRRQELQRFTRLLHGRDTKGEAHIIMTGSEYESDHKRLFGIMDKGFKIVLHRQGVEDKTIKSPSFHHEPRGERVARPQSVKERQPKSEKQKVELSVDQYPLLKYAGIRKIVEAMNGTERKIILFLIDPQNQNQSFTDKQIALSLGYANPDSINNRGQVSGMLKKGYIMRSDGRLKQNFSSIVG